MSKFRFLLVGAGAALAIGAASALANAGAITLTSSDSHGDSVASAARTTCPHGPNGVHGHCVSAIASSKSDEQESDSPDTCKTHNTSEDTAEKSAKKAEDASEKSAKTSKSADHGEDSSERSAKHSEDKTEKQQVKPCEAAED
jgi:hypothetical protein